MEKIVLIILLWLTTNLYSQDNNKFSEKIQQEMLEMTEKITQSYELKQQPGYWIPIFKISQRFQGIYSFDEIKKTFLLSVTMLDLQFGRYKNGFFLLRFYGQTPIPQQSNHILQQSSLGYGIGGGGYIIDKRKWRDNQVYRGTAVSLIGIATSSYGLPTSEHDNYTSNLSMNGGELNIRIEYFFSAFFHMYIGFDIGLGGYDYEPTYNIDAVNGYVFYGGTIGFGF